MDVGFWGAGSGGFSVDRYLGLGLGVGLRLRV